MQIWRFLYFTMTLETEINKTSMPNSCSRRDNNISTKRPLSVRRTHFTGCTPQHKTAQENKINRAACLTHAVMSLTQPMLCNKQSSILHTITTTIYR